MRESRRYIVVARDCITTEVVAYYCVEHKSCTTAFRKRATRYNLAGAEHLQNFCNDNVMKIGKLCVYWTVEEDFTR